jgi:hypothetical protein
MANTSKIGGKLKKKEELLGWKWLTGRRFSLVD